jgi:AcrR family transcriptional regulator
MAERGFAGTSIAAVSERSGLPSGSIYWHFESKEALLAVVVEEGARRWFDTFKQQGLPTDPVARTDAAFDALESSLELEPEFLRLLLLIALERREVDATSLAAIRRVRDLALERIHRLLVDLLTPLELRNTSQIAGEFARFVLVVADGAFVAHHIDPERSDIRRSFGLLRRALTALALEMRDAKPRRRGRRPART